MDIEIEAKWLGINHDAIRKKLKANGATLIEPERIMIRKNFDFGDKRLERMGGWVRVRDEGGKITMSYKQLNDRTLYGTQEVTLIIDDFDKACNFLESIGLKTYSRQETKRESWRMGNTEIELDTWPWIPGFIEIEASSEQDLKDVAETLGLDYSLALHGSVEIAYQAVYDVSEEEIDNWREIIFSEVPGWLASKKRQALHTKVKSE